MVRPTAYWGFIVIGVGNTMLGSALPSILRTFQIPPSGAGALILAGTIGYLISVLIGGPAGDRFGRRIVLAAGAGIYVVGLGLFALAPTWPLAILTAFVGGIGSGVIDSGMNALANDIAAPQRHAVEQSVLHFFFGVGALIGPLLIGAFLAGHYGWRPAYGIGAGGSALLLLLLVRLRLPDRSTPEGGINLRSVATLAGDRLVLLLCAMIGLYVGEELVIGDWASTYLRDIHHLDSATAATSVGLFWAGLAAGRLLSAIVARWFSGNAVLLGTTILSLLSSLALVFAPSSPVALVALVGCGIGYAAVFPLLMAVAGERFPEMAGSVAGLLIAAASMVGAILPTISGFLVQRFDARAAMALTPFCAVGILIALAILHRDHRPVPAALPGLTYPEPL